MQPHPEQMDLTAQDANDTGGADTDGPGRSLIDGPATPELYAPEDVDAADARETLRRSRERFRAAFEVGPTAASIVTLDGQRFVDVNRSFTRILGYARDDVVGRTEEEVGLFVDPEEREQRVAALRTNASYHNREHRVCDASGDAHTMLTSATLIPAPHDLHILTQFSDLSKQRRLESEILRISEEEQRRIGRDLHDSLASHLTGIAMYSQGLADAARSGVTVTAADLDEVARLAAEGVEQARALARGLNPVHLGKQGLETAVRELASDTWTVARIPCHVEVDEDWPDLPGDVATHLYRIAQEAVTNAVRHADAERIRLCLRRESEHLLLLVEDDGKGITHPEAPKEGLGLSIMRNRAEMIGGALQLDALPGGGTRVRCLVKR